MISSVSNVQQNKCGGNTQQLNNTAMKYKAPTGGTIGSVADLGRRGNCNPSNRLYVELYVCMLSMLMTPPVGTSTDNTQQNVSLEVETEKATNLYCERSWRSDSK